MATQAVSYLISDLMAFNQECIAAQATCSLSGLIFEKNLRVSSATNKQFKTGEIVNFLQADTQKLYLIAQNLPTVVCMPLLLLFCSTMLFLQLGVTFLFGVAVFMMAFYSNLFASRLKARIQKEYMKFSDSRMSLVTECLNNIKMIKMYAWI